ncbi:hypothetical protein [Streptomyces sp. SID3212]|uniref:hypothetical protein n=1 Tax=Streptomyces sp. SID3212 TaxID=2690259 RepID=UPI001368AE73|nr:hypothetical protein [Streptomyces sp. SID3212]MYV57029.1 hypothetical protein [Streptomyces sp. SID3212]
MRTERAGVAIAVLALALTAGCGANDNKAPQVPKTATGSLEQLASKAKCEPNISTDAAELRQANCATGDGKYVLATFATDRGQREWINEAKDYGGSYLVGRKWVVVGEAAVVATVRGRLGGEVETGSSHHAQNGGGTSADPSGHDMSDMPGMEGMDGMDGMEDMPSTP